MKAWSADARRWEAHAASVSARLDAVALELQARRDDVVARAHSVSATRDSRPEDHPEGLPRPPHRFDHNWQIIGFRQGQVGTQLLHQIG